MRVNRTIRVRCAVTAAIAAALAVAGCSSGGSSSSSSSAPAGGGPQLQAASGTITLSWWHNGTADPLKTFWQQTADAYHAAHPSVSFQVDPIQNEQFTTKVPAALQSNDPPDIYQQWGGGNEASQVQSHKVADITSNVSGWISELGPVAAGWQVNGRQYGVPYDQHVVGFWYRKDLFQQAGITDTPTTMADLTSDISKLKAAHIAAVAIGSKDRWPDAFYWDYFAVRECSTATLKDAAKTLKLTDSCWTKAGQDVTSFLALQPFQTGFLGTPAQQGAGSSAGMVANGQAAMELQGDWEPGTMASLTQDKDLTSKIGWFPFPSVPGGKGDPQVALGGGDGFSCTSKATTACADFLKYVDSAEVQTKLAATGVGVPANPAGGAGLTDPNLKAILDYSVHRPYIQNYFDIAFPTNVGQALDDAVANYFAGQGSPQAIVSSVTNAASGGK